jgi:hypothetical protein
MAGLETFDGGVDGCFVVDGPGGVDVNRERGAVLGSGAVVEVEVRRRVEVGRGGEIVDEALGEGDRADDIGRVVEFGEVDPEVVACDGSSGSPRLSWVEDGVGVEWVGYSVLAAVGVGVAAAVGNLAAGVNAVLVANVLEGVGVRARWEGRVRVAVVRVGGVDDVAGVKCRGRRGPRRPGRPRRRPARGARRTE